MNTRLATADDVNAVVDVVIEAFKDCPSYDYLYPYREEHPEVHRKYQRMFYEYVISPDAKNWRVMVAEMPSHEDPSIIKIVATAIWDLISMQENTCGDAPVIEDPRLVAIIAGIAERKDANPTHMKKCGLINREMHFRPVNGLAQIELYVLATHPAYRRLGLGTALCEWGTAKAEEIGGCVILMASKMGYSLYCSLKFIDVGDIVVEIPGEDEALRIQAMVFLPSHLMSRSDLLVRQDSSQFTEKVVDRV